MKEVDNGILMLYLLMEGLGNGKILEWDCGKEIRDNLEQVLDSYGVRRFHYTISTKLER